MPTRASLCSAMPTRTMSRPRVPMPTPTSSPLSSSTKWKSKLAKRDSRLSSKNAPNFSDGMTINGSNAALASAKYLKIPKLEKVDSCCGVIKFTNWRAITLSSPK